MLRSLGLTEEARQCIVSKGKQEAISVWQKGEKWKIWSYFIDKSCTQTLWGQKVASF